MSLTSPAALARRVHRVLYRRRTGSPGIAVLDSLFNVMFGASLQREEQQPILFQVVYLDPENPDPEPPPRVRENRWTLARLATPLPLSVATLVKLAQATDPRTSSIVVYPGPN